MTLPVGRSEGGVSRGLEEISAGRGTAIVVLGCRIFASGRLSAPAKRRALAAARAYHEGVAPIVIASGGRRWGSHVEASALRLELVRQGVPSEAIIEELCSLTTLENAIFSAAILERLGSPSVALVTCPWHMPRAARNFRAVGVELEAMMPADPARYGVFRRLWQRGHEIVSSELDAFALRRMRVFRESLAERARAVRGAL